MTWGRMLIMKILKDYTHAIGGELSCSMLGNRLNISGRYMYEYAVKERLKGQSVTINIGWAF